jgi:U4/U6 small nuclear ribonucleoprotein PRP31
MHGIELSLLIQKILDFVEARMVIVASNLSAVVGTAFAAKLMITPGSPTELANMTSCDVQLLGSKKMILAGYSWRPTGSVGYNIEQRDVVQATPPSL